MLSPAPVVRLVAVLMFFVVTANDAVLAQAAGSWFPVMPGGNPSPTNPTVAFLPKAGFPRPGDLQGQLPAFSVNPFCRVSGIHGFTDTLGTPGDPNDDREYLVSCRSDGLHLIDVTPQSGGSWTATASQAIIPATNSVRFLNEPQPTPFGPPPSVRNDLYEVLNGWNGTILVNGDNTHWVVPEAYAPTLPVPFPYTSQSTTNREAVAWYEASSDRWFLYSASVCHAGIWVVPLQRVNGILDFIPGGGSWFTANGTIGLLHSIYIDAARAQLWVCEDWTAGSVVTGDVKGIQIGMAGSLGTAFVMTKQYGGVHDAMPVGDRLFVSSGSTVDVYNLPATGTNPATSHTVNTQSGIQSAAGHSCYFDATLAPSCILYTIQEGFGNNFARFDYTLGTPDVHSNQVSTGIMFPFPPIGPDVVHHIRGVMLTGFFANYNRGITLASLSSSQSPVLASYDTSPRTFPVSNGNAVQNFLNGFDGTWDVYPGADSGMVCASAGDLGAVVFQVKHAVINRYWSATPFQSGAAAHGMFPTIVAPFGPPRINNSFLIRDANSAKYPTANGTVTYCHTLYLSLVDPVAPTSGWVPSVVTAPVGTGVAALDYTTILPPMTNPIGNDVYYFATMGTTVGEKWFGQMVVEELVNNLPSGRWAASRGTWIGVAL